MPGHTRQNGARPAISTVVSEFVSGISLADLLDTSLEETVVPGVDAALGYLTESLSALGTLHQVAGFPHGLIAPDRAVFTAEGRLLFLDPAYAAVVDRLGLSRRRLWTEFGIAAAPGPGPARLDAASDLSQAALIAMMLILGRRLDDADYPDNIPSLLMEVVEVAQIRGSSAFAGGLQRILQRLLPLPGRRPYETAEEAVADLRQLLRREMGADVCQKALLEFIQQLHPAQPVSLLSDDETLEQESPVDFLEEPDEDEAPGQESPGQESIVEFELDLDGHVERREDRPTDDDVYELSSDDLNEEFGSFAAPGRIRPVSLVPPAPVVEESVRTTEATPESREIEPTDVSAPSVEIEAQYELEAARETEAPIATFAPIATSDAVAVSDAPALENAAVDPEPQGDVISSSSMVEDPEQVEPASMDAAPSGLEEPVLDQAPATELSATDAWTPEPAAPILSGDSVRGSLDSDYRRQHRRPSKLRSQSPRRRPSKLSPLHPRSHRHHRCQKKSRRSGAIHPRRTLCHPGVKTADENGISRSPPGLERTSSVRPLRNRKPSQLKRRPSRQQFL